MRAVVGLLGLALAVAAPGCRSSAVLDGRYRLELELELVGAGPCVVAAHFASPLDASLRSAGQAVTSSVSPPVAGASPLTLAGFRQIGGEGVTLDGSLFDVALQLPSGVCRLESLALHLVLWPLDAASLEGQLEVVARAASGGECTCVFTVPVRGTRVAE